MYLEHSKVTFPPLSFCLRIFPASPVTERSFLSAPSPSFWLCSPGTRCPWDASVLFLLVSSTQEGFVSGLPQQEEQQTN